MKYVLVLSISLGLLVAIQTYSATQSDATQGPSAEIKKLGVFVGKWNGEISGSTPDGKTSTEKSTETCEWQGGGFAVVCTEKTAQGLNVSMMGYDKATNKYLSFQVSGDQVWAASGTVSGDTWVWNLDKGPQAKVTTKFLSPDKLTTQVEFHSGATTMTIVETQTRTP